MRKNVIILTHGWTGSSVFTALLGTAGYWYGDKTFKKVDYDTHENLELIELNKQLMAELAYEGDHEHEFDPKIISELASRADKIDMTPYQEFVDRCLANQPWIWKDPRLTWTIRVWAQLMPLDNVSFVILTRDPEQAWISSNLRRHIQSRDFTARYNTGITTSLKQFLSEKRCPYLEFEFEDLLLSPEDTLAKLNNFLGIKLTIDDLGSVYHGSLYKKSKGLKDKIKAAAIYFKNYGQRYK